MIVVSDTSPICYLLLIDYIEILPELYQIVIIPQAVANELHAAESPSIVRGWISQPPSWLRIQTTITAPEALEKIDPGEREAILLAEQLKADLVILDDKAARRIASKRGLTIIGLLGILKDAANADLLNLETTVKRLRKAGFWVAPSLLKRLMEG